MRIPELTAAFNERFGLDKSESSIRAAIENRNITCGRKGGLDKGVSLLFTPDQVAFIRDKYRHLSRADLAAALNETFGINVTRAQVTSFVKNHKIHSGRTGRYEKGNVPFNAGTRGVMKPNSGSFKKGQRPVNYKPIGHERVCVKDGYVLVKVDDRNPFNNNPSGWYRHKHVVLWEEYNGPVPAGFCIRFKDGDRKNITIENLIMVSRAIHARLTLMEYGSQPEEVKPVLVDLARLDQAVYEKHRLMKRNDGE